MASNILLKVEPLSNERLDMLESLGIVSRITPDRYFKEPETEGITHVAETSINQVKQIYETHESYGPHKLIAVQVRATTCSELISHPDREDFMLIGRPTDRRMILILSKHKAEALQIKRDQGHLSADDFLALSCIMNDPETSFFTMHPDYPHGECCMPGEGPYPSFYVSEPRDLPEVKFPLGSYTIELQ